MALIACSPIWQSTSHAQTLADAIDRPGESVSSGGDAAWIYQTDVVHDSVDAAKTGPIPVGGQSWMEITVAGPTDVSFWWKVSSGLGIDEFQFSIDGVGQGAGISGERDWTRVRHFVPAGSHALRWTYSKFSFEGQGSDCGWVDQVVLSAPAPNLQVEAPAGSELNTGSVLSMGRLPGGQPSVIKTVILKNVGGTPLETLSLALSGPHSGEFAIDSSGMSDSLAPGASTSIGIQGTPAAPGRRTALLEINSNDPDESPFELELWISGAAENDDFADREALGSVLTAVVEGTCSGSGDQAADDEPDLSDFARMGWLEDLTVWYEWTAPAGVEWARINLAGPNLPTVLSVYTGSDLATLSRVALNRREIVVLPNRLTFPVTPGTIYQIRAAFHGIDFLVHEGGFPPSLAPADLDFTLELSTIGTPVSAADHIVRGRGWLETGDGADVPSAEADFSSALAIDAGNEEARFLRATARLMRLETDSATDTLLTQMGATRTGSLRSGGTVTMPMDVEGDPIPGVGSHTSMAIDYVNDTFLPRLASIRGDLDLITSDSFRTDLIARETGGDDVYVDKGDVLALKAVTHGLEMMFHLAFTYDLDVSLESLYILKKLGYLNAQDTLATFTSLLEFSTSDRRPQFDAAMRAMEQDYLAAIDFIRDHRGDPAGLTSGETIPDSPEELEIRDSLAAAVMSLDGEVTYLGHRLNLSRLIVTSMSARDFLPELRGDYAVPGTLPDPTFDGILPGMSACEADSLIYRLGALWGMAQYAEEFGDLLEQMGYSGGPYDDSENDGNDNFSEWLRGSDPLVRDVLWQNFTHQLIGPGDREVQLSFIRRKDLRDWELAVWVSEDLETWDRTGVQVEMVGSPVDNGDGFSETVTYRLTDVAALADRKFMKVEAVPK